MITMVGLEGRLWQSLTTTRRVVLQPSGHWCLDADEQLWTLSASQRFPAGVVLHLVAVLPQTGARRITVIRDQVDATSWRCLNAWLRADRSIVGNRAAV
ncbi:MAG: hypothetical protein IPK97_09250 [Ahniella sp.]|nr:hypothetical protein [Ahniella sp.]